MKTSMLSLRKLSLGLSLALGLSACGDLNSLLNNPQIQQALKNYLSLSLNREIDGTVTTVKPEEIKSVSVNGKALKYEVNPEGQLVFAELPADADAVEVQYQDAPAPVVIPLDPRQEQQGKLMMRAVSRFSRGQDGQLAFQENLAGFDFDRDGAFDDSRPQFVQQTDRLMVHDLVNQKVQRFDLKPGERPNLQQPPREVLQGERFFMPMPPLRPGMQTSVRPCGAFQDKEDGSIDFPLPTGEARNLKAGEFELGDHGQLKIIKAGEPDTERVIMPPPCVRPGMQPPSPMPGMQPPSPMPGMQPPPPSPAPNPSPSAAN